MCFSGNVQLVLRVEGWEPQPKGVTAGRAVRTRHTYYTSVSVKTYSVDQTLELETLLN